MPLLQSSHGLGRQLGDWVRNPCVRLTSFVMAALLVCGWLMRPEQSCPYTWRPGAPMLAADVTVPLDTEPLPVWLTEPNFALCGRGDGDSAGTHSNDSLASGDLPQLAMLVGVLSAPANAVQRKAQRESWLSQAPVASRHICENIPRTEAPTFLTRHTPWASMFVIGLSNKADVDAAVRAEADLYGDILLLDHAEGYFRITRKTVAFFEFVVSHVMSTKGHNVTHVFKTDDDTFLNVEEMLLELDTLPRSMLYWGKLWPNSQPRRLDIEKQQVSQHDWPDCLGDYPPFMSGAGFALSTDLVSSMLTVQHRCIQLGAVGASRIVPRGCMYPLEDVQVSMLLHLATAVAPSTAAIGTRTHEQVHFAACGEDRFFPTFECSNDSAILIHQVSPEAMRLLHSNLVHNKPLCS